MINWKPFYIKIIWPWFFGSFWGFAFAPFIFIKEDKERYEKHEATHIIQQYKHFILGFWLRYIYQLVTKGYRNIDYEIEAREAERK